MWGQWCGLATKVALQLPGHIGLNAEECNPQLRHLPGPSMWLEPQAQESVCAIIVQPTSWPCRARHPLAYAAEAPGAAQQSSWSSVYLYKGPAPLQQRLACPVQAALLHALREQSRQLRQTVGTCVAAVVAAAGLAAWPELVQRLAQSLDGGDALQLEGALDALHKVGDAAKQKQPTHGC